MWWERWHERSQGGVRRDERKCGEMFAGTVRVGAILSSDAKATLGHWEEDSNTKKEVQNEVKELIGQCAWWILRSFGMTAGLGDSGRTEPGEKVFSE